MNLLITAILVLKPVQKTAVWMANSVDPDQIPCSAASDLGLHYLLMQAYLFVCLGVSQPSQHYKVVPSQSVYLYTPFLGRFSPLSCWPVLVHTLSTETNNCPSWISGRGRMTIENISWSISMKECCWTWILRVNKVNYGVIYLITLSIQVQQQSYTERSTNPNQDALTFSLFWDLGAFQVHLEGWAQDYCNSNIFLKPLFRGNLDPFVNNANLGAIAHTSNGT